MHRALRRRVSESARVFGQVLRNPSLRRLEAAWAAALISGWAYSVAIVVYTYEVGGPGLVGAAYAIKLVPAAIAAAPLATLADRWSRKRVLLGSVLGQALATASVGAAIALDAPVALVIAITCVLGVLTTALQPAVAATIPTLCARAEELTAANVTSSTLESLAIFVGPAIGGIVVGLASSAALAAATGGGFLLAASFVARLPADRPERLGRPADSGEGPTAAPLTEGFAASLRAGFGAVTRDPGLRLVIGLMAAQTFVDGALTVLTAVAALELLDTGDAGIGYLNSAIGVGAIAGSVLAAGLVGRRLAPGLAAGLVLWGVPIALVGILTSNTAALVLFGVVGVGNILIDVAGLTMLQRAAPERMIARVLGVLEALILTSIALGSVTAPLLLDLLGDQATFIAIGAILPLLALVSWRSLAGLDLRAAAPAGALAAIAGLPFFAALEPETIEAVAGAARRRTVAAGEAVFRQGDAGDRFYVILSGEAEVLVDGRRARIERGGDHFGEIALLREVPRTATVIALGELELLSIDGPRFVAAVSGHRSSRAAAGAVVAARLAHLRPARAAR